MPFITEARRGLPILVIALTLLHSSKLIAGDNDSPTPKPKPTWSKKYNVLFGQEPGRVFGEIVDENGKPLPRSEIIKIVIHDSAHFVSNNASMATDEEAQVEGNQFRGPNRIQFPPQSIATSISIDVLAKDRPPVLFKASDLQAAEYVRIVMPKKLK